MGIDQTGTEKLVSSKLNNLDGVSRAVQDEAVSRSSILYLAGIDVSLDPRDDPIGRHADKSIDGVFELVQRERVDDRSVVERGRCVHVVAYVDPKVAGR
jgi:hypothetical protein